MEILTAKFEQPMRNHIIEITAWVSFFAAAIGNNLTLVAGLSSVALSFTGIILNLIKIYKENKK